MKQITIYFLNGTEEKIDVKAWDVVFGFVKMVMLDDTVTYYTTKDILKIHG